MTRVYLAGPIRDIHNDQARGWRDRIKEDYGGIEWLDPLDKHDVALDEVALTHAESGRKEVSDKELVNMDLTMIDKADAVLVNWLGCHAGVTSVGTPMEVFYAARSQPVVVRGERAAHDPAFYSPWLTHHVDEFVTRFEDAVAWIAAEVGDNERS